MTSPPKDRLTVWQAISFLWHITTRRHFELIRYDDDTEKVLCLCGRWAA